MEWYANYEIGVPHIDAQHKELVAKVSVLQEALAHEAEREEIAMLIRFLVDYTKKHFGDEEQLMQEIRFYDLENHKKLHKLLIQEVKEILVNLKKGKSVDAYQLIDFLTEWLLNHIRQEDKKIGKAIAERA